MAELAKKLYIRKNGVVTAIKRYSTLGEVQNNGLPTRADGIIGYSKLDTVGAANGTALRVRKSGTVYQVNSQIIPAYGSQLVTTLGSFTFTVPNGVSKLRVTVVGGGGGGASLYGGADGKGEKGGNGQVKENQIVSTGSGQVLTGFIGKGGRKLANGINAENGQTSSFSTVSALGGQGIVFSHHVYEETGDSYYYYNGTSYSTSGWNNYGRGGWNSNNNNNTGTNGVVQIEWGLGVE